MGNNIVKDYIEFISFCVSKLYEIDIVLKLDINRYREDSEVVEFKVMYENYKNLNIKLRYTATRYLPIGFEVIATHSRDFSHELVANYIC